MTENEQGWPEGGAPLDGEAAEGEGDVLAKAVAERDAYLDQLQRSVAEFANYRRRTEQERDRAREQANAALLRDLLPVLDDLQDGLAHVPAAEQESGFVNGFRLVEQKFRQVLERYGIARIESEGAPFDPSLHEAVDFEPGGDTVTAVYRQGYRAGPQVVRPAMVKVGRKQA